MGYTIVQFTTVLSTVFTSAIIVQAGQRFNVGIWIGSAISSPTVSAASATVVLQRKMNYLSTDENDFWRDVNEWAVQVVDGLGDNVEEISAVPEPETCQYRLGVTSVDVGTGQLRIGNGAS